MSGKNTFGTQISSIRYYIDKVNKINGLIASYNLMILGDKKALDHLNFFGIHVEKNTPQEQQNVYSKILKEQTYFRIKSKKEKALSEEKIEGNMFLRSIVSLQILFKMSINKDRLTLSEYVELVRKGDEYVKAQKNGQKNRR